MKILLAVDLQNDFVTGALGSEEAVVAARNAAEKIRREAGAGVLVIFTQDTHGEDYPLTQEGRRLPVPHCIENTEGWRLHGGVIAAWSETPGRKIAESVIFNAVRKNTFGSRELIDFLLKLEEPPGEIEIIGLCTDICVISNALLIKAYFPETAVGVDAACCAGTSPQGHENALAVMRACQIDIKN